MTTTSLFLRWQELNRSSPATWPGLPQAGLLVTLMLTILLSGWHLHLQPALDLLENNDQTIQTLTTSYGVKYRQAAILSSLQKQEHLLTEHLAFLEQQLPFEEDLATVFDDISAAAHHHHLHLDVARPGSADTGLGLTGRPVSLHLSGNYHDIGRFAADLAATPHLLILNKLRLTAGEVPGTAILEANALTYFRQRTVDGTPGADLCAES